MSFDWDEFDDIEREIERIFRYFFANPMVRKYRKKEIFHDIYDRGNEIEIVVWLPSNMFEDLRYGFYKEDGEQMLVFMDKDENIYPIRFPYQVYKRPTKTTYTNGVLDIWFKKL